MATVHTEYGPGQIIERETVRGRTRYKVAGEGFEVWLDQTRLGGLDDYDEYNDSVDDRDGYEEDIHNLRHKLHADEDFDDDSDPSRYSRRLAWAPLDRDNSTELPYNPDPQYDAIGSPGDDGSSTIQPIHNIDSDERLTPANSISFEEGEEDDEPAPSGDLFAREGALAKEAVAEQVLLYRYGPQIKKILYKTLGKDKGDIAFAGLRGHSGGETANQVNNQASEVVNWASPGGPQGGYGNMIHNAGFEREGYAQLAPLLLRVLGPSVAEGVMSGLGGGEGGDAGGGESDFGPGEGYGDMIQASRLAGLSDRYIDLTASVDYHNDPVAQFRHDPIAYINRIGHLYDEGLNPRFAEYMDLVEADGGIRTSAWKDVRKKAMRLKREGHVTVKDIAPNRIMASVVGDHGTYDVAIFKAGSFGGLQDGAPGHSISNWHCGCEWGKWAFRRKYTYVGRLCSHAYASYLTMQSEHMKGKPRQQKGPKRKAPARGLPVVGPSRGRRSHLIHADALQNGPERLTPEMVVNDADDAQMFVDVTKDERDDVGPDDVMSEQDIVHFARVMRHCEANEQPYPRRLVAFLARYADCLDGGDDTPSDYKAQDGSEAGEYLDKLRDLADGKQSDDFGSMADRVHAIQHTVEEARSHGVDASQFVASLRRTAAPGDEEDNFKTYPDGGRSVTRNDNGSNTGVTQEGDNYTMTRFDNDGTQGQQVPGVVGTGRYEMDGQNFQRTDGPGGTFYRSDDGAGDYGFRVDQNGNRTGVEFEGGGQFDGPAGQYTPNGDKDDEFSEFGNFLDSQGGQSPAPNPAPAPGKPGVPAPGKPGVPAPGQPAVAAPGAAGAADASGKAQTSGTIADGGVAGAENGNNAAITKTSPGVDADGNYTVGKGDTWSDIAQRTTGDMNNYQRMYDVNKGVAGGNIDSLAEGTKINVKDFLNDTGNNGMSGAQTNPASGGLDKNPATADAGPAVETGMTSDSGNTVSTANGFAATKPKPAQQTAIPAKQTSLQRRGKAPAGGANGSGEQTTSDQSGQPAQPSAGTQPAVNPATGQPSSAGGATPASNPAVATPATPAGAAETAAPDKESDTFDPNDPNQVAQNAQARPGQQPAVMPATAGGGMGSGGAEDFGNAMDMVGMGVGAASDIASGVGDALSGMGGFGGLAGGIGSAISGIGSIFASKQDFDDFVRYAYPAGGGDDFDPETLPHIPFAGSGNPGPLEIGTSEEYADEQRPGMDDVTDLESHDVESSMAKWQKQGAYDDDSSDIVRAFQANLGETALGVGAGGGGGGFDDIAGAAQGFLRTAGRNYSLAEQSELIREGDKGGARNLDSLDLTGTHYEDMTTLGW